MENQNLVGDGFMLGIGMIGMIVVLLGSKNVLRCLKRNEHDITSGVFNHGKSLK